MSKVVSEISMSLDETQIHLIPILLGDGIRLFEGLDPEGIELRKIVRSRHRVPPTSVSRW